MDRGRRAARHGRPGTRAESVRARVGTSALQDESGSRSDLLHPQEGRSAHTQVFNVLIKVEAAGSCWLQCMLGT